MMNKDVYITAYYCVVFYVYNLTVSVCHAVINDIVLYHMRM